MLKKFAIFTAFLLGMAGFLAIFGTPIDVLNKIPNHISALVAIVLVGVIISLFFGEKIDPEIGGSEKLTRRITVGRSRAQINYAEVIGNAKNQITVIGLSLPAFSSESVTDQIRRLANSGVSLRIVVANPFGKAFHFRRAEVYVNRTNANAACQNTLSTLTEVWSSLSHVGKFNLEVFVQDRPPTVGILKVDEKILWSPVFLSTTGALAPYLVVAANEPVFGEVLVNHINETLICNSRKLDLSKPIEEQCIEETRALDNSPIPI